MEFLNPYNFIPFPSKKAAAYSDTDKHTGVIEYTITTKSPLFIPNTSNDKAFSVSEKVEKHGSFDFYSYTELGKDKTYENEFHEPVIPGSELRGMLRSVYETLTDSCMGVLNEKTYPVMRIAEMYRSGLIHRTNSGFELVDAEDCIYRKEGRDEKGRKFFIKLYQEERLPEGSLVYFSREQRTDQNGRKLKSLIDSVSVERKAGFGESGYLIKGESDGSIGKKHNCHIFIPKKNVVKELETTDIDRLQAVLKSYHEEAEPDKVYSEYQKQLDAFLKGRENTNEYFPVYYSKVEENLYLAPACFTKEASAKSLKGLAGPWAPCNNSVCPACALFGSIGSGGEEHGASKIRVADAKRNVSSELADCFDEIVTLETLNTPKLQNVEFYLKRPANAQFWNYDYYTTPSGTVELYDAALRGRKFYWHQNGKTLFTNVEPTKFNKTVRPVKKGIQFKGKVFFDGISGKQLNQLLWILNGGTSEEQPESGPIAYKLGMGKPLGLGSIVLEVDKVSERNIALKNDSVAYEVKTVEADKLDLPDYESVGFSKFVKRDAFTIMSLDAAKEKLVCYPVVDGQQGKPMTEGFEWFAKNHIGYDPVKNRVVKMPQKRIQMKREYVLPEIADVRTLPILPGEGAAMGIGAQQGNNPAQAANRTQNGNRTNAGNNRPETGSVVKVERGAVIECTLSKDASENTKGPGYVGNVYLDRKPGLVFNLSEPLKKGTKIKIRVTNVRDTNFFAEYQQ